MFSGLKKLARSCLKPVPRVTRNNSNNLDNDVNPGVDESFIWSINNDKHSFGDFSFAVVQANEVIEDRSQVETGDGTVFVSVYDGHGGFQAAQFVADHLYGHLTRIAGEKGGISEATLMDAVAATEEGFLEVVQTRFREDPLIAAVGTCCLAGVISGGTLFIANLGDSRAVVGSLVRSNKIVAEQLTEEHNAKFLEVRRQLRVMHPSDSEIVVFRDGVWRVKGIIQVSRAIGGAFLKSEEFSLNSTPYSKFYVPGGLPRSVLSAVPSMSARVLKPNDKFIIFASDGLWEYMTNEDAVQFVHESPRTGIAERLAKRALRMAAVRNEIPYEELCRAKGPLKRALHDDISVVIIFIDKELLAQPASVPRLSIKGLAEATGPSGS